MMMRLLPAERNWSGSTEGLGGAEAGTYSAGAGMDAVPANSSRTVLTPLHGSGLMAIHYWLPIGIVRPDHRPGAVRPAVRGGVRQRDQHVASSTS